jgi:glucose/arabinose dehydrogenase
MRRCSALLVLAFLACAAPAGAAQLQTVATGLSEPTYVTGAPGDDTRLFVTERAGRIRVVRSGSTTAQQTPFLSLGSRVDSGGGEEGLLSMAFAPDYASSGVFYVAYTRPVAGAQGNDLVVERRRRSTADVADPDFAEEIIRIEHRTYSNHNGGQLQFDREGGLWLGTGDGGGANDPLRNGQNRTSLLGKLLRLDLAGGAPEIWAYGLRNPWRFSFDRSTGDLTIGDVGQSAVEEINFAPAPGRGQGANYGWPVMEGDRGNASGLQSYAAPRLTHTRDEGWQSITGGYVVRDPALPGLDGCYVYGDFSLGELLQRRPRHGDDPSDRPPGRRAHELRRGRGRPRLRRLDRRHRAASHGRPGFDR